MCKEIWCEIYDDFVRDNEREPSHDEMNVAWESFCGNLIDCYTEK